MCQNIPAYTEANIQNNRLGFIPKDTDNKFGRVILIYTRILSFSYMIKILYIFFQPPNSTRTDTISPIYLSRMLNSISCSISICRDDSLSIVSLIELSRRFSNGLWSCIQVFFFHTLGIFGLKAIFFISFGHVALVLLR